MHHMFLHDVETNDTEEELWYYIEGKITRFSRVEFALITSLRFRLFPDIVSQSDQLRDTYFSRKLISLKTIQRFYERIDFSHIDDM